MPRRWRGASCAWSTAIAYINHDIDDALRAGVLDARDLPAEPIAVLGATGSQRIDTLVHDLVEHSERAGDIVQGEKVGAAMAALRAFMFEHVYLGAGGAPRARAGSSTALRALFDHYCAHPERAARARRRRRARRRA